MGADKRVKKETGRGVWVNGMDFRGIDTNNGD